MVCDSWGQRQSPLQESISNTCPGAFAEPITDLERPPRQHGLHDGEQQSAECETVHRAEHVTGAGLDRVNDPAEQPRTYQTCRGGKPVSKDDPNHSTTVCAQVTYRRSTNFGEPSNRHLPTHRPPHG